VASVSVEPSLHMFDVSGDRGAAQVGRGPGGGDRQVGVPANEGRVRRRRHTAGKAHLTTSPYRR